MGKTEEGRIRRSERDEIKEQEQERERERRVRAAE